jgi:hypothetical protein
MVTGSRQESGNISTEPTPGSSWTLDTESDLNSGISDGLIVTPEGSLELELRTKGLVDNFVDEGNLSSKDNVYVDISNDTLNLIKSTQTFGKINSDEARKLIKTSDGGYAILGNSQATGSDPDAWLLKLDSGGNLQWASVFGGLLHDMAFGFSQTNDNGFIITGYTASYAATGMPDLWLIKTDASGNEVWNVTFDVGVVEVGFSVVQMTDGGYLVGGHIDYQQDLLDLDVWLIKTDGSGKMVWNATYGGSNTDHCADLIPDTTGGFVFTGYTKSYSVDGIAQDAWLVKVDGFGVEQWNISYGGVNTPDHGNEVIQTADGGFAIIGNTESYDAGMGDVWLIKTNGNGVESWNQTYGGSNQETGHGLLQTGDNGFAVIGYTSSYSSGLNDLWLIKTDSNGLEQWSKNYGGVQDDTGQDIVKTPTGFALAGDTVSFSAGLDDIWLLMVDETGNFTGGRAQSNNLLADDNAVAITEFEINTILSTGSHLKVRFSIDGMNWVNSAGSPNEWDPLVNTDNYIDLSGLNWSGSSFYYQFNFSTESGNVPRVDYTNLKFMQFKPSGTYQSPALMTDKSPVWKTIEWNSDVPKSTALKFQIRTAATESGLAGNDFIGPDGTNSTYYILSGTAIWDGHNDHTWLEFIIYMETTDLTVTPVFYNVTVGFNRPPEITDESTVSESFDYYTEFNFTITYSDLDSDTPSYVNIELDGINYSMNEGNFISTNFIEGRIYWFKTEFSSGFHAYRFFISDSELGNETKFRTLDMGAGSLVRFAVDPESVTITTDEFQTFTAVGYDIDNNILNVTPTWTVTGGGSISSNGTFTPTTPGIWTIFANLSGISGNATVTVTPGELDNIAIDPESASITTDDNIQFEVKGYDADGNELSVTPAWSVTGGGTIDTSGNFTASKPGTWTVFANVSEFSIQADVTVALGSVHTINVDPDYTEVNVSENAEFSARAYDADGNELTGLTFTWEINGGAVINYAGKLTGKTAGNWTVYANNSGVSGTAMIWVKAQPGDKPDDTPDDQPGDEPEDGDEDDSLMYAVLVIIAIIIVVMLVLFFIFMKRKRGAQEQSVEAPIADSELVNLRTEEPASMQPEHQSTLGISTEEPVVAPVSQPIPPGQPEEVQQPLPTPLPIQSQPGIEAGLEDGLEE